MPFGSRELVDDVAVPIEAEPRQAVDDRLDGRRRGARAVGVLDAQQVLAAVMAGVQPVEERRARAADMKITGGRGGEAGDDCLCSGVARVLPHFGRKSAP